MLGWQQRFSLGGQPKPGLPLPTDSAQKPPLRAHWQGNLFANYEFAARDFRPLNPYRPAEFSRDWNLSAQQDTTAEHLLKIGAQLEKQRLGQVKYSFGAFRREGSYDGSRHFSGWSFQRKGWDFSGELNLVQTDGQVEKTRFSRPKADLSKTFFVKTDSAALRPWLKVGIYAEREKNARQTAQADTLTALSFWYDLLRAYFQTPENQGRWQWGGHLSQRNDFAPNGSFFQQNTQANDLNLKGNWNSVLPSAQRPFSAAVQPWHVPVHAASQQTPSVQKPLAQSAGLVQLVAGLVGAMTDVLDPGFSAHPQLRQSSPSTQGFSPEAWTVAE